MISDPPKDLFDFQKLEEDYLASISGVKPLIGYLCLRVPPEYIEAYGAVPIRIAPRSGFDPAENGLIRPDGCSFCRTVPAILKTPYYRNLSAILAGACCDQMRRLMEVLRGDSDLSAYFFGAPRTWNSDRHYFQEEMVKAFDKLKKITGRSLDESVLRNRIQAHNELNNIVNRLRDQDKLPNSLLREIACTPLPPEDVISFLKRFDNQPPRKIDIRLMLAGSIPGIWELELIESNGAKIVADVTCLGDRVFHHLTPDCGNHIDQLYDIYVESNLCPHRLPVTPLLDYIKDVIARRKIDGVVYRSLKYCHPWGLLARRVREELELPVLTVDDDLTSPAVGNFRTRVGAFTEMLQMRARRTA